MYGVPLLGQMSRSHGSFQVFVYPLRGSLPTERLRFIFSTNRNHDWSICRTSFHGQTTKRTRLQRFLRCLSSTVHGYVPIWRMVGTYYSDAIMSTIASQITSLTFVYSTVYSGADHRKHQSSASLAFVRGIHRGPVNSPHKWPVTRKMFPFDDVIMNTIHKGKICSAPITGPTVLVKFDRKLTAL